MVPPDTPTEGVALPSAPPATPATPAGSTTPASPVTPAAAKPPTPAWAEWLTATATSLYRWLIRPRVRLTVTGVLLLLVGGLIATNTVWTLPLVIIGALMVAVAWLGHRLDGRFAVEWGEDGTQLAFRATIKSARPATDALAVKAGPHAVPAHARPVALARASTDVIEGEAHTVEINVGELKALIAAAEAAEAAQGAEAADGAPVRDIRIRRLAEEPDRTPRPAG